MFYYRLLNSVYDVVDSTGTPYYSIEEAHKAATEWFKRVAPMNYYDLNQMYYVDIYDTPTGEGSAIASFQETPEDIRRYVEGDKVIPIYSDDIMQLVRQQIGLESYDTSRDREINDMSRDTVFEKCLVWEGIIGYEHKIKRWISDIYDVNLG